MAVGLVDRQKLVNIADAVRAKKGITGNMTLDAIASNITSMPTADNNAKFDFAGSGSKSSGSLLKYLTTVDLTGLDTSSYTDMSSMFSGCTSLTSLDLSNLDTGNVTNMSNMFHDCSSLLNIDLSKNNLNKVKQFNYMFGSCKSLESLKISAIESDITNVEQMFLNCWNIKSIDLSNFRNKTTSKISVHSMFDSCTSVESIDISGMDFSKTYGSYSFYGMCKMFADCQKLKSIIFPSHISFDNSNMSMNTMFYNCYSLENLDLRCFDTSKVTTMEETFLGCIALKDLNVSSFNTTNVSTMYRTFESCKSLTSLDLSNWNTTSVTNMGNMFKNCWKLTNLTLGENWASNSSLSSFSLSDSPLTRESAVDVINKLATRSNSPVITFSNKLGLYQSEINVATNKGWSVSGCTVLVDAETATVGQYALIDGVASKCVYVADTAQDWGQRIFASQSYVTYSNGNQQFQWGGYGTATGITATDIGIGLANTNSLIAMNLQSSDGAPTVWDALKEFRASHSDRWFIPSKEESSLYIENVYWTSSEVTSQNAYTRNTSVSANSTYKASSYNIYPFTYV